MNSQPEQQPNSDASSESATATPSHSPAAGSTATPTPTTPTSGSNHTQTAPSTSTPPAPPPLFHNAHLICLREIYTPDPKNARLDVDPDYITQLAADMQTHGQLHPIAVTDEDGAYTLVAGNSRLLAAKQLGWPTITAIIIDRDALTVASIRLSENLTRRDISPVEEAAQLAELVEVHPDGVDGVATQLHRRPEWILGRLELLTWPPSLQAAIHTRRISMAAGSHLAHVEPHERRERYIAHAVNHGISAQTAALWRRDSQTDFLRDSETSEFTPDFPVNTPNTESGVQCKFCQQLVSVAHITIIHCCTQCLSSLDQSLDDTPTEPQPSPPTI